MNQWGSRLAAAFLVAGLAGVDVASAQPVVSATAATVKELGTLLSAKAGGAGPRFIAAEDPTDNTRFVAAMLLPDLQLLLVAAAYKAPVLLRERVLTRKYQDAYQDLQAASIAEGKIVIEDLLANGLAVKPAKGQGADLATIAGKTVTFDGQWRKAKIAEADYGTAYTKAEQEYTRLLALLISQAKLPLTYALAIFDFDGTLADSWQLMAQAIVEAADQFGYRRLTAAEAELLRGQDNRAVMAAMGVRMWQVPRIAMHMQQVALTHSDQITLFAGVEEMLRALDAAGVRVAVVSSNGEEVIRRVLGLDVAALVSDFACGAALFGKAAKFRGVVRRAGVAPSQAIGVGDEGRDIDAAAAAGIATAAVTWGYATRALLESRSPTHVVTSVGELTTLLVG